MMIKYNLILTNISQISYKYFQKKTMGIMMIYCVSNMPFVISFAIHIVIVPRYPVVRHGLVYVCMVVPSKFIKKIEILGFIHVTEIPTDIHVDIQKKVKKLKRGIDK